MACCRPCSTPKPAPTAIIVSTIARYGGKSSAFSRCANSMAWTPMDTADVTPEQGTGLGVLLKCNKQTPPTLLVKTTSSCFIVVIGIEILKYCYCCIQSTREIGVATVRNPDLDRITRRCPPPCWNPVHNWCVCVCVYALPSQRSTRAAKALANTYTEYLDIDMICKNKNTKTLLTRTQLQAKHETRSSFCHRRSTAAVNHCGGPTLF